MNKHFDQIDGSDWMTKQDRDDFARYCYVYSKEIEPMFGHFDWDNGTFVPFTAPLTVNGKALVTNQFDTAIDWEIYLRGPNAGVTNLMFSAMPQYIDLKDVASKIAKAINAKYSRRRDSDYGQDCVYLYSIGNLWMAIYCSFGAHGGTIEGILGDFENVSDYANNCM